jgi:ParB/RepB/Spo0J family partition protein
MIPIDKIDVLNPRDRNTKAFKVIVGNIKDIGLKKPIKVTPRTTDAGEQRYVLVFGEGRLTAFRNLGEKEIPAIVVEISDEDAFLMSLVENIARRQEKAAGESRQHHRPARQGTFPQGDRHQDRHDPALRPGHADPAGGR